MKLPKLQTFSSLSNGVFRLYFIGMVGQWAAMSMGMLVRPWVLYSVSGSGTMLGLAALANAIPMIIFSLWGGAIADRIQKKYILLVCMLISMLVSAAVGVTLTMGYISAARPDSWWILIAASFAQGGIMGAMMPARQAIITEIVTPDRIMNAVSLNNTGMNALRILAPAASGFIIEGLGFASVYYVMGAMYLFGAVCMFCLPGTTARVSRGPGTLRDILDGFAYIKREKVMLYIMIFTLCGMICGMPYIQLMPMIIQDVLKAGADGQGVLTSISGAGAVLSSLVLASMPGRKRGIIMLLTGGVMALALVGFGLSNQWWFSVVTVVFVGIGQAGYRTAGNALVQTYAPPEYHGRVMSFMMMGIGFSGLGTFLAGILAESIGIQWAISGIAIIFAVVTIVMMAFLPALRKVD